MLTLLCLSFVAMSTFSLILNKHQKAVVPENISLPSKLTLKISAWLFMTVCFYISVTLYGWSIGPSALFGCLTISIMLVVLVLTYQAKQLLLCTILATILGIANLFM